jgi:hypothetical protein
MANDYYGNTGYPAFGSPGSSAPMRGEFTKVENAFSKCQPLVGNSLKFSRVNVGETAMEGVAAVGTGSVVLASGVTGSGLAVLNTDPTFVLSDVTTNNASTSQHGWMQKYPGGTTTFLRGDATFAAPPGASLIQQSRSSNTILAAGDNSTLINYTAGSFTQTLTAAATLGNGWFCYARNSSSNNITFDPNGGELIDGATTGILEPGMQIIILCTGTAFVCYRFGPSVIKLLTSGTSGTWPLGVRRVNWRQVGAGGSGAKSNGVNSGGVGAGGGYLEKSLEVSPNTAYTFAIGVPGASQTTINTAGNAGTATTLTYNAVTYTTNGGAGGTNTAGGSVAGGTATNGDINISGGRGVNTATIGFQIPGGTPFSPADNQVNQSAPVTVAGPGGGGDGATSAQNSSAGGIGLIALEY